MGLRNRVRKVLAWGVLALLALAGGAVGVVYFYVTDGDTLAALLAREGPRFLPGCDLRVGKARVRPFLGEVVLGHVTVEQQVDGRPFLAANLPYLQVRHDPAALLEGRYEALEVRVAHPTLRLRRRADGTWNVEGLIADPWPGPPLTTTPAFHVEKGTVQLCDEAGAVVAVLREVALRAERGDGTAPVAFEGSARGDASLSFDRLAFKGTLDIHTGRLALEKGELTRLVISETLRDRLPAELKPALDRVGLEGGEVDVALKSLTYDPAAPPGARLRHALSARLRAGVWNCPELPFSINDLHAGARLEDGLLTLEYAEGRNGRTTVEAFGTVRLDGDDPEAPPMDLEVRIRELGLDERLRDWTPDPFGPLWDEYQPAGVLNLAARVVRDAPGGPIGFGMTVACVDVSMKFFLFPYPLEHIRGELRWSGDEIDVDLETLVGDRPMTAKGKIRNPGDDALVDLAFEAGAFPIDDTLFRALPADVLEVVSQFNPRGSVRGTAMLSRRPPEKPTDPKEGIIEIHADLELNERCSIKWVGLPYPVDDLRGKLELHPDRWVFREMRGRNGLAEIGASGEVQVVGKDDHGADILKVGIDLRAEKLNFDAQLYDALAPQPAWQKTWAILNPRGSCDVLADIRLEPGQPEHYHLVVKPGPETSVTLKFDRVPKPGFDPGGPIELRMEGVRGTFDFLNGTVTMRGVDFGFHGAPVRCREGQVTVADTGRFELGVRGLAVDQFRFDGRLRRMMPSVMAQFAQKLGEGQTYTFHSDLGLAWSGTEGESVLCRWDNATVVLNGNTIQLGSTPVRLEGQLDHLRGSFDGQALRAEGALRLASLSIEGQQVTQLESPVLVRDGVAELSDIQGRFLEGMLRGAVRVSLDATPRYEASVSLQGADLQAYARTLIGPQSYRGQVSGELEVAGQGSDPRTLQGGGWVRVDRGDLGELPFLLTLFKTLKKLAPVDKTAFDSARLAVKIQDGVSVLDPILLAGDAFSLAGKGTMGVNRDLDLRLQPLYGRDRRRVPLLTDAFRELGGQIMVVRVTGTPDYPKFGLEPLPHAGDLFRAIGRGDFPEPKFAADRPRLRGNFGQGPGPGGGPARRGAAPAPTPTPSPAPAPPPPAPTVSPSRPGS